MDKRNLLRHSVKAFKIFLGRKTAIHSARQAIFLTAKSNSDY